MRNKLRRPLAFLLSAVMIVTMSGTPVHAVADRGQPETGLCEHHAAHTDDCGYTEETPGTPCTYVCEICNPQDSGEADKEPETGIVKQEHCSCLTLCTEGQINPDCPVCGAEDSSLSDCKGKSAEEDMAQPEDTSICKHHREHDESCGYQPASENGEGSPCTYECRICPIEELIAALPDVGSITDENAEKVRAQLEQILALFAELTGEEQEQLDLSRCYALQEALDGANDPDLAEGHAAQQEGDEARVTIGGVTTYYTEFAEAWKKAQEGAAENPATVTLLKDVTLTETLTVTSGQNITLTSAKNSDGNDFTMNYAPEKSTSMSSAIEANGGTFELKGGTINVDDESSHGVYVSGGTFKLTGGAIRVPGDRMHGVYVYGGTAKISGGAITVNGYSGSGVKVSSGTAIISGGTITANGSVGNGVMVQSGSMAAISGGAITANGSMGNGVNVTSSGTATITGGTITADNRGVDVSSGTATISGGTITADSRGVYVSSGTATISGGTITADSRGVSVSSGTTTITGGTITAGDWGVYAFKGTTTITGGTIKSTGGAIYNESGTLLEMLGQTGDSPCAYWQGSELVALTEGQNELPAGTYTVKECQHNGEGVCEYTPNEG
ncbi:hypothetical protein C814_01245, partial [Anaerotruncus sp. G3(2012)]|uniref:hypothetical protein n=1 Tax=Anaerotruncus sp. G3(2012) TaxID=1235835 RepID=UPI000340C953